MYEATALDDIVEACLEFSEDFPNTSFYTGNIDGRKNVPAGQGAALLAKMKYIAKLDIGVLEYLGFGTDNIQYFNIGPKANQFLSEGGFSNYFKEEKRQATRNEIARWAPIIISLVALVIAALTWLFPLNKDAEVKQFQDRLNLLEQKLVDLEQRNDSSKLANTITQ